MPPIVTDLCNYVPDAIVKILSELKDRKLVQWALAYLASAWLIVQLADVLGPRWGLTAGASRALDIILIAGFLMTLVVAWYHGEQGRQRVSGAELLIIAALLVLCSIAFQVVTKTEVDQPGIQANNPVFPSVAGDVASAPRIALLPFRVQGSDPALDDFAAGLASDIHSGLSKFSHLLMLSPGAAQQYDDTVTQEIGTALDAHYVMRGNLRRAGVTLRLTMQFIDMSTGATVWTETYDRQLTDDRMLAIQDEITSRIVATVGDVFGIVARTLASRTEGRDPETLSPYEAVLRWFLYQQRVGAEDHKATRAALERAVAEQPDYADAWSCLSNIYLQEYMHDYNQLPNALDRALDAAERAVKIDQLTGFAHYSLAQVYFFRKDLDRFRATAERAIELNPLDTNAVAMLGILMGYGGDWVRSVELTERAMALNPNHPGWYRFNTFFNEYRQENYEKALEIALRIEMPNYFAGPMVRALAYAELGQMDAARASAGEILELWPEFEREYHDKGLTNWIYAQPALVEQVYESLQKAGLDMVR